MNPSIDYFEQLDKHLVIFDFDETICQTNAKVKIVHKPSNTITELTPTEYSVWREKKVYEKVERVIY